MENPPEVPIIFEENQKWITGLTPKTTCDDVIHSVLINVGCPIPHEAVRNYALFENWRGIERPLKGRSRFLKLYRDWGDERANVEVTMRKVDSSVKDDVMYGTMRRKNRIKDWFKTKDKKKSVSKSMHNICEDMHDVHNPDDSSILAQDKDNMFCAFTCYKKKNKGLRERNSNIQTPFERPRSVAVVPPRGLSIGNPTYQDSYYGKEKPSLKKQYSFSQVSHYGSKTSLKQTYVSKRRSCYIENDGDIEQIYSTAREPVHALENHYEKPTPRTRMRLPQNVLDWDYDYNGELSGESDCERDHPSRKEDYNDTRFKSLLNLVLSQERKIQEQFARIKDADKQIEQYEFAMHKLRSAEQGKDYLQDTYLSEHDETISEDGLRQMDELGNICDKVTLMDDKLREQYAKLHDLSLQLETETQQLEESIHADNRDVFHNTTQPEGPFESTRIIPKPPGTDSDLQSQIATLRQQLQKSISMSLMQQNEIKNMDINLYHCQQDVQSKQTELQKLLGALSLSSYEQSLLSPADSSPDDPSKNGAAISQQDAAMFQDAHIASSKSLPRQLKSLSDLQRSNAPLSQPGMRKSVSDFRGDRPGSAFNKHCRISREISEISSAMRSLISTDNCTSRQIAHVGYNEMGVDVGETTKRERIDNKTDDVKQTQRADPNSEVQRIMSLRQPVLTPIKEQDFTHTIIDYHNETVDLDALYKTGRFQNPTKMFHNKLGQSASQNDEQSVELYEASGSLTQVSPLKEFRDSALSDVSASTDVNRSTGLPPLGVETMSIFKGKRLMPSLFNDTKESEILDSTDPQLAPLVSAEESNLMSSESSSTDENSYVINETKNTNVTQSEQNNTSIWNTQEIVTDDTFTVATAQRNLTPLTETSNVTSQSGDLTFCGESTITEITESSPSFVCPNTDIIIKRTIAMSLSGDSPISPLAGVKKRLFTDDNISDNTSSEDNVTMNKSNDQSNCDNEKMQVLPEVVIPEVTKLESSLSPYSASSESCESGVGSMQNDEIGESWSSLSFSETTV